MVEEANAGVRWTKLSTLEEGFLKQRSKIHWLKLGDQNNRYFHKQAEARKARNAIRIIQLPDGSRKTDQESISAEAVRHFSSHLQFMPPDLTVPNLCELQELLPFRCSSDDRAHLLHEVTAEEIQQVLFSMPPNKAPGPDGYSVEFFKAAWSFVGHDFIVAVRSFFQKGFLPHGVNSTILTLVPKKEEVFEMKDYRPIACCNVVYKVISKLIANRFKEILPRFVADNQSAFIKDRLLLENVLLASELVKGYHLESTSERAAIKFDISKAFDSIQWSFITTTLRALNFPEEFVHWIHLCISTASFSVQVNGELAGYFRSSRGLRQGCSLSPYIFVMCMNVLSAMLDKAARNKQFGYHPKCKSVEVTHLCFADDILVFTDGSYASIAGVSTVFTKFAAMSGLKINPDKTCLFLAGGNENTARLVRDNLGYVLCELPIRYLGLPLMTKRMSSSDYKPLLDKIRRKMDNWSTRWLSFAGRYQLIRSVVTGIIQFWAAAFWLPRECITAIDRLCSGFLWSGVEMNARRAKVKWKDICFPKEEGGLGIRDIREANQVFGLKLFWRLFSSPNSSLWTRWVQRNILKTHSIWTVPRTRGSWCWRRLLTLRDMALPFTRTEVGDGVSTKFWLDNWTVCGRLINLVGHEGPRLFGVPLQETVAKVMVGRNSHRTHRLPQLNHIEDVLDHMEMGDRRDKMLWRHRDNSYKTCFSTNDTWHQLRQSKPRLSWTSGVWFTNAVPKHAFLTWISVKNRLATMDRLTRWMPSVDAKCALCSVTLECRDHLFFTCPYARTVWRRVAGGIMGRGFTVHWTRLMTRLSRRNRDAEETFLLRLAFQSTLYTIWIERNNRKHNNVRTISTRLARQIDKAIRNKISALQALDYRRHHSLMRRWLFFTM